MGAHAARKARRIAENTLSALAYELLVAAQATQLRSGQPSPVHQELIGLIRERVPFMTEDRELRQDIAEMNALVRENTMIDLVAQRVPKFD